MIPNNTNSTPATATIPAAHQSCDCAESDVVLMRRADATKAKYYDNVRKGVAAVSGVEVSA